ncbi:hypothetical protein SAV31267_030460 [Streptomyces avermitilis]|uniref:Uncharacterized protein n=1 Tax=Streptomyces avermitilis TaxID=33903 RepID=A0A4D4MN81_STRAX|nr:hypothetical protein SAV31267_030460 [Streptomyces avermitilis]
MQSRFQSDRRLTARMTVTLFLLGLLYLAFVAALIVLLKSWVLVVVIAAAFLGAQYWFSDRIALYAMRGRIVEREEYPSCTGSSTGCPRWPTCPTRSSPSPTWRCRTRSRPGGTPITRCCA